MVSNSSESETELEDVVITDANFVATSPEREHLNEEWVEISNLGDVSHNIAGWFLHDEQNHGYYFPDDFVLDSGAAVKVHTGKGNDSATDLYMNMAASIWNNDGDVATLEDDMGNVVSHWP
jgi:hypothetical protein